MRLNKGEFVLLEPADYCAVSLYGEKDYIKNLKMTNFAIVYERAESKRNYKRGDYDEERIDFKDVQIVGGSPQVFARNHPNSEWSGSWLLQIFTKYGGNTIEFSFDSEEEMNKHREMWIKQINHIITGTPIENEIAITDSKNMERSAVKGVKTGKVIGEAVGSVVEDIPLVGGLFSAATGAVGCAVGGIIGGISGMFKKKKTEESPASSSSNVETFYHQIKCKGCHATINGISGSVVTCDYCDTEQIIEKE